MSFMYSTRKTCIVSNLGWSSTARMPASSLGPFLSLLLTPWRHRQADGQLSPLYLPSPNLGSFGAACMKLCCLPPSSLVRNTRLCCLIYVWNVRDIKIVLPWTWRLNHLLYLRTQWMRLQRRSQLEHDHHRRADRARQITASFTRDRRRAHWHI